MNLSDVSPVTVASLAAAAAFGWGLVSTIWKSVGCFIASATADRLVRALPAIRAAAEKDDDNDKTPPPPSASSVW